MEATILDYHPNVYSLEGNDTHIRITLSSEISDLSFALLKGGIVFIV